MRDRAMVKMSVVGEEDADREEIDGLAERLAEQLMELEVDAIERSIAGAPPPGAKAGISEVVGVLVATGVLSATTIKAIADVVASFVQRSAARSVSMEIGDRRIEITGARHAEIDVLLQHWHESQRSGSDVRSAGE